MADIADLVRPVGWWVKEADAALNDAFERALQCSGVSRREWQLLTTVHRSPIPRADAVEALTSFDTGFLVDAVVTGLELRDWVVEQEGRLQLTQQGVAAHMSLLPLIDGVRRQVSQALPPSDYRTLIELLARLVDGL